MKSIWAVATLALAVAGAAGAIAQPIEPNGEAVACPGEPTSVYFASGDATLSHEGKMLVSRLVDHAVACRPEGIDIVTRINVSVDGDSAVALALARLDGISRDLVARGVSPEAIRVAARPGNDTFPPGMSEVEVSFRKAAPGTGEASSRVPATPRLNTPPGTI